MIFYMLFSLFFIKHFIISNILDIGYSESRSTIREEWRFYLFCFILTEISSTFLLISRASIPIIFLILSIEVFVLLYTTIIERRANFQDALKKYIFSELLVILTYLGFSCILILTSSPL